MAQHQKSALPELCENDPTIVRDIMQPQQQHRRSSSCVSQNPDSDDGGDSIATPIRAKWHLVKRTVSHSLSVSLLISHPIHDPSAAFIPFPIVNFLRFALPALNWVFPLSPPTPTREFLRCRRGFRIHPIWTTKRYCSKRRLGCELEPICRRHPRHPSTPMPYLSPSYSECENCLEVLLNGWCSLIS